MSRMLQTHTLEIRLTLKAPEPPVLLWGQLGAQPAIPNTTNAMTVSHAASSFAEYDCCRKRKGLAEAAFAPRIPSYTSVRA
jgi:hypothetical protein